MLLGVSMDFGVYMLVRTDTKGNTTPHSRASNNVVLHQTFRSFGICIRAIPGPRAPQITDLKEWDPGIIPFSSLCAFDAQNLKSNF